MKTKLIEFLQNRGILDLDKEHFIIKFMNGVEVDLVELLDEFYHAQFQPQGASEECGKCFICNEVTDSLAANPGKWGIYLPHFDGVRVARWYHYSCLYNFIKQSEIKLQSAQLPVQSPAVETDNTESNFDIEKDSFLRKWTVTDKDGSPLEECEHDFKILLSLISPVNQEFQAVSDEWISVKDRLPEKDWLILGHNEDGSDTTTQLVRLWMVDNKFHRIDTGGLSIITHWLPIPRFNSTPKEESQPVEGSDFVFLDKKSLLNIRRYFGEHDKTTFEHWAYSWLGTFIPKLDAKNHIPEVGKMVQSPVKDSELVKAYEDLANFLYRFIITIPNSQIYFDKATRQKYDDFRTQIENLKAK